MTKECKIAFTSVTILHHISSSSHASAPLFCASVAATLPMILRRMMPQTPHRVRGSVYGTTLRYAQPPGESQAVHSICWAGGSGRECIWVKSAEKSHSKSANWSWDESDLFKS